jgi:hypothetical protein
LHSWTEDEPTHFFSGQATYEKQNTVPGAFLTTGCSARLHFGPSTPLPVEASKTPGMQAWLGAPVRDAALVYVNDQRAGTVWAPPYSIEVTGLLHIGINRLRIVVGNTAMNEMAGEPLPDYRLLYSRYGKRFEPQDMDKVTPLPSGLLGPVRLISGP